jgi:transposase-like protein
MPIKQESEVSRMAKGKYEYWLTPDGLLRLEAYARDGLTDEQIAHNLGITAKTLYEWKNKYSEICEALKRGKEVIDLEVENALLKRALGYKYKEVKTEEYYDLNGELKERKTVTVKEVVPDTTAQIFWLKNRKPSEWRDKQELQHSGSIDSEVSIKIGGEDYGD